MARSLKFALTLALVCLAAIASPADACGISEVSGTVDIATLPMDQSAGTAGGCRAPRYSVTAAALSPDLFRDQVDSPTE